jgi:hypothetical protein
MMISNMSNSYKNISDLKIVAILLLKMLVGAALFIVFAVISLGVSYLVICLEEYPVNQYIVMGLQVFEWALFVADFIMGMYFIYREVMQFIRQMNSLGEETESKQE